MIEDNLGGEAGAEWAGGGGGGGGATYIFKVTEETLCCFNIVCPLLLDCLRLTCVDYVYILIGMKNICRHTETICQGLTL